MPGRRCSMGCETWPDDPLFTTCSICGEKTRRVGNGQPTVSFEDARLAKLHELFEEFYARRCEKLGIPAEGPLDLDSLSPT